MKSNVESGNPGTVRDAPFDAPRRHFLGGLAALGANALLAEIGRAHV